MDEVARYTTIAIRIEDEAIKSKKITGVLQIGLAQIGATEPTKRVITGLVIIAAVILDVYRNRSDGVGSYFKGLLRS